MSSAMKQVQVGCLVQFSNGKKGALKEMLSGTVVLISMPMAQVEVDAGVYGKSLFVVAIKSLKVA